MEKGVFKCCPKFYPNPTISSAQTAQGVHSTLFYIPQHKHNLIILYWGNSSQLNICLKEDVIISHSEQVDEDLSQLTLALPGRGRILVHSQLDISKIDLTVSLEQKASKLYPQTSHLFVAGLSVAHAETPAGFGYFIYDPATRLIQTLLSHLFFNFATSFV